MNIFLHPPSYVLNKLDPLALGASQFRRKINTNFKVWSGNRKPTSIRFPRCYGNFKIIKNLLHSVGGGKINDEEKI